MPDRPCVKASKGSVNNSRNERTEIGRNSSLYTVKKIIARETNRI